MDAIYLFLCSFVVAALGGLASLLRSHVELSRANVLSAILNNGLLGVSLSCIWYVQFRDNLYFLVGLAVLSGLAGTAGIDAAVSWVKRFIGKAQ